MNIVIIASVRNSTLTTQNTVDKKFLLYFFLFIFRRSRDEFDIFNNLLIFFNVFDDFRIFLQFRSKLFGNN
jgi:hypothetical protein